MSVSRSSQQREWYKGLEGRAKRPNSFVLPSTSHTMSAQQHNPLAANWDPEILAAYMAKPGEDSDEAMSSDESDSEVEFEGDTSMSSVTTDHMSDIDIPHPADIASNDSAFSSEDEFAEESITQKQTMRREVSSVMDTSSRQVLTKVAARSWASDAGDFAHALGGVVRDAQGVHEAARRR